ncbi:MAG: BatA domain-containing protein [Planctomycetota bacterium]
MGFLTSAFLYGLGLALAPILIHLFFRMRKKRLVFSSLQFLNVALRVSRRRLRLRDLILLILRTAAIALLALGFARPWLLSSLSSGDRPAAQESLVIILDDSPSMGVRFRHLTRFSVARDIIRSILNDSLPEDRIQLVLTSDPTQSVNRDPFNRPAVEAAASGEPTYLRGSLTNALARAERLFNAESPDDVARRRVVIISDFQSTLFDRNDGTTDMAVRDAFIDRVQALRRIGVIIETIPLHTPDPRDTVKPEQLKEIVKNIGVIRVKAHASEPSGVQEPTSIGMIARIDADVRASRGWETEIQGVARSENETLGALSFGSPESSAVDRLSSQTIAGSGQFVIAHTQDTARNDNGSIVRVVVESSDPFSLDDVCYASLSLNDKHYIPIIASSETTAAMRFSDPAYYLNIAAGLEPETREPDSQSAVLNQTVSDFRSHRIPAATLTADVLKNSDAVILSGMNGFKPAQTKLIREYIQAGGGAIWFLGGAADAGVDPAFSDAFNDYFGVRIESVESSEKNEGNEAFRIKDFDRNAEPFAAIADASSDSLRALSFYKRVVISQPYDSNGAAKMEDNALGARDVIAEFSDGSPAVLRVSIGSGKLFLFLSAPSPDWSVLYRSRLFVPLLHQTLKSCVVNRRDKLDFICGEPLPDRFKTGDSAVNVDTGDRLSLDMSRLRNAILLPPGGWRIESESGGVSRTLGTIAVNIDPSESEMTPFPVDELFPDSDEVKQSMDDEKFTAEPPLSIQRQSKLWRWFLLSVALCLLAEGIVLAWDSRDAARVTP